ncbi:U4/U6 small nuclear ribonucleoprotein Prp31 [Chloropicon roscoffensis]|uniref:U4/U6 small nuclear ribonucleoprotein Prp31 n=2 Tax=Chloropicon roscoffensis TaxID=1461544 RepID=A0AAX4P5B1_9CHLO
MATLADSFLDDLEDLSDGEGPGDEEPTPGQVTGDAAVAAPTSSLRHNSAEDVSKLSCSPRYLDLLALVRGERPEDPLADADDTLRDVNALASEVDTDVANLHAFCRQLYKPKFPELETLVHHPVDYARVVRMIGNETDLTELDLGSVLPSATVMVVSVTASTTTGRPLPERDLAECLKCCELVLKLDEDKSSLLKYVEERMGQTAPNLSAVLGSECASRLLGVAGGLTNLSKIPACNIQVLGSKKSDLAGMSSSTNYQHRGLIAESPLIKSCPPQLRKKALRLVAGKCALLARVDAHGEDAEGAAGGRLRQEIEKKIEKWQEPPPARIIRPLAVPDSGPKKRRGGRRLRKMKERYGMTELRKAQNRVNFNMAEEEIMDGEDTVGLGLVGQGGGGGDGKAQAPGEQQEAEGQQGDPEEAGRAEGPRPRRPILRPLVLHRIHPSPRHRAREPARGEAEPGGASGCSQVWDGVVLFQLRRFQPNQENVMYWMICRERVSWAFVLRHLLVERSIDRSTPIS